LISNEDIDFAGAGTWGSLSSWEDAQGTRWVLAPVWGPKHPSATFAMNNGDANVGSIAAFKVEEKGGKPVLTNAWISRNLMTRRHPPWPTASSSPWRAASGCARRTIEKAAVSGETRVQRSQPAILYALDAATGKELWSSGSQVTSFTHNGS
jgi:PQQ enzyme repeat.